MFLGVDILLKLVKEQQLVENLCKRELTNPEGVGFDLQLGEVFSISGDAFLGIEERKTCEVISIAKYNPDSPSHIIINPADYFLVKTIEKVNMPDNLVGIFKPRSTLQRTGLILRTAQVPPGYSGELIFGLHNAGPAKVTIELGARFAHLMFCEVKGKSALYRGQWQGGRVTTTKLEKQV